MSFDIFVAVFRNGCPASFQMDCFERIFGHHEDVSQRSPKWRTLHYKDGGEPTIFIDADRPTGFTANRPGGITFFDDLYKFILQAGAVIYWPADPPRLVAARPDLADGLPADMSNTLGPATVVQSGSEILAAIKAS